MKSVKARKDEIVRQSTEGVESRLKNTENLTVYEGHGRFESPNTVSVKAEVLEADKIVINVGGRALVPEMPGAVGSLAKFGISADPGERKWSVELGMRFIA